MNRAKHIAFFYDDYLRMGNVTLSSGDFYPELPVDHLLDDDLAIFGRTTGRACTLKVDLGIPRPVGGIVIPTSTLSPAATQRLRMGLDPALLGGTPGQASVLFDDRAPVAQTTSITTATVGTGIRELTVIANIGFAANRGVLIEAGGAWMSGDVVTYDSARRRLTVDVTETSGAGSHAGWTVKLLSGELNCFPGNRPAEGALWGDYPWAGQDHRIRFPLVRLFDERATPPRYLLHQIADPTATEPYLDLARYFVGPVWQPSRNLDNGYSFKPQSLTETQRRRGGGLSVRPAGSYRVLTLSISYLSGEEAFGNAEMMRHLLGTGRPFLTAIQPDATRLLPHLTLWGSFTKDGLPTVTHHARPNRYQITMTIEEWPDERS